ncbi:UvrD-helicase domain-containing protein [Pseudomonas sp. NPDC088444]|uniref:UvrD-helicase domain-containing protein n=1 Tax=Pseudomonas sp. NPDC088444 TaxID=3364456 RepID=UPI00384CCC09
MRLSDEQKNVIDAELGPISVTACAGSGKTSTAIRRLIAIRQKMGKSRGRVVLLSFSNVAVNTFYKGYQQLAAALPDDANRKLVEVDTLDGFFTQHVLRPHAYRTMAATKAAYLVGGSEPFLSNYQYWPGGDARPLAVRELKVGMEDGHLYFFIDTHAGPERLITKKAQDSIKGLGATGAYTHEFGRYWVYRTLVEQPAVLRALATRYPQILVDESQDLGTLHQAILELLIQAGVAVSLIGDVNQGIYGFAGADGMFLHTYEGRAGVKPFNLTRNYRSLPPIIDIANRLCGRKDEPDRDPEAGGAYFVGYKDSELPKLFESFKARVSELQMQHHDAAVLCRSADRTVVLAGKVTPPGQGSVAMFSEAALLRDQHGRYQECFRLVCRAVVDLLPDAPYGLSSELQGSPHEGWMLRLRRLLWAFIRNQAAGLPSSTLVAKSDWHPKLVRNLKILLASIEKQFGLRAINTLGNKLAKTKLLELPLDCGAADKQGVGLRVETVHQVKGESIGAVLYVAKKPNVQALLAGTDSEEGRIGYVAVTRARNLFWLAVPNSCLKELREELLATGFTELPALK